MMKYSTIAAVLRHLDYDWYSTDFNYFQITGKPMDFQSVEQVDLVVSEITGLLSYLKVQHKIMKVCFVEKQTFFIALWVLNVRY